MDMINRLDLVVFMIENLSIPNLVIVGHQANLRCIYGYLMDVDLRDIPYMSIPLHTVIKLDKLPDSIHFQEYRHFIDV